MTALLLRLLLVALLVCMAGLARADVPNSPPFDYLVVGWNQGTLSSPDYRSIWSGAPDGGCPDGQWKARVYTHGPFLGGPGSVLQELCIGNSQQYIAQEGLEGKLPGWFVGVDEVASEVFPMAFACPDGSFNAGGNCMTSLVSVFDPATAFEFFVSSFGLVVVCWMTAHGAAMVLKAIRQ